jgi:hypothetical protein
MSQLLKYSENERIAAANELMSWALMLIKSSLMFQLGFFVLFFTNKIFYAVLCLFIASVLYICAEIFKNKAVKIYPPKDVL